MMKKFNLFLATIGVILFLIAVNYAQKNKTIIGTIGKEHMVGNKLVICELGTQACMFLDVAPQLKVKVDNQYLTPEQLQVGWYVEVDTVKTADGNPLIRNIKVSPQQTIFCFFSLNKKQSKHLKKLLSSVNGIDSVKFYLPSKQVFVQFNPKQIIYHKIEKIIRNAGYEIE